mmetsp:Transcript_3653/g.8714  ORF Transcript_3653/g.8714 Transcript_3653/m.8714 type:complete len:305 (+) Transcript_3653:6174-7088(+)
MLPEVRGLVRQLQGKKTVRRHHQLENLDALIVLVVLLSQILLQRVRSGSRHTKHIRTPFASFLSLSAVFSFPAPHRNCVLVESQPFEVHRHRWIAVVDGRERKFRIVLQVHVQRALHRRTIPQRQRQRVHGPQRQLPELKFLLLNLDVRHNRLCGNRQPNRLAAADQHIHHAVKDLWLFQRDGYGDFCCASDWHASSLWLYGDAVDFAFYEEHGVGAPLVFQGCGFFDRVPHTEHPEVQLFLREHGEALLAAAAARDRLVVPVLRLQREHRLRVRRVRKRGVRDRHRHVRVRLHHAALGGHCER